MKTSHKNGIICKMPYEFANVVCMNIKNSAGNVNVNVLTVQMYSPEKQTDKLYTNNVYKR